MNPARAGGVLLHLSSLPGPDGIGDLGQAAHAWLGWMGAAGLKLWQFLPLGPVGPSWSPYQSPSTFAGNPLLISLDRLVEEGWLEAGSLHHASSPSDSVHYDEVAESKASVLRTAAETWKARGRPGRDAFEAWAEDHREWLEDFALFMAIKESHNGRAWREWAPDLAGRRPAALNQARAALADRIEEHRLQQFWFFRQWAVLRQAARQAGVRLIGDLPIYVAYDSADVWAHPELYRLAPDLTPTVVAGVPPDYFSETGQLWSNPIYRWERHQEQGFAWWTARVAHLAGLVDTVRLDHFRGLELYWEVPGSAATAVDGRWVEAPGAELLGALQASIGSLPLIAEDLGVITERVERLRDSFGLPGMRVMQFGLEAGQGDSHLPDQYPEVCVAYTGTHDNDTSLGWYQGSSPAIQDFSRRYLASDGSDVAWRMIEAVWSSPAGWALAPLQDFLGLGRPARMNTPGRPEGNWAWRAGSSAVSDRLAEAVRGLGSCHGRT